MPISGVLDVFGVPSRRRYPFFTSGDLTARRAVIFIGGLFNGLGDVPYLPALSTALGAAGWKLVQLHWTSAYDGFGTSSLDTDVRELSALVAHLRSPAGGSVNMVVVMGHSTGSQDVIRYLTTRANVQGGIMQAPVSDREHFGIATDEMSAAWCAALPRAQKLIDAGRGAELVEAEGLGMRLTAYRLVSLMTVAGDDDYFSSDLPTEADGTAAHPLAESFGRLSAPALALFSEKDEYAHIPGDVQAHLDRWVAAAAASGNGPLSTVIIKGANHAVEDPAHHPALTGAVVEWLTKTFG